MSFGHFCIPNSLDFSFVRNFILTISSNKIETKIIFVRQLLQGLEHRLFLHEELEIDPHDALQKEKIQKRALKVGAVLEHWIKEFWQVAIFICFP